MRSARQARFRPEAGVARLPPRTEREKLPVPYRKAGVVGALALTAIVLGAGSAPARTERSLSEFIQPGVQDVHARMKILSHNDKELGKVGKGYVELYGMSDQEIWCKEPDQVRVQGKKGFLTFRYVTNGNRKLTEVSTLHLHKVEDISKEPSKGYHMEEIGLITPAWLQTVESHWERSEAREGKSYQVFTYWYKADPKLHYTIWVDPTSKTVTEMIAHHRAKKRPGFKKRVVYSELKQINGVWLPTKVSIYNTDNQLGGEMRYDSIQVNSGIPDSLFKI
jgi:outer membrane lipoprotein-sorting protein